MVNLNAKNTGKYPSRLLQTSFSSIFPFLHRLLLLQLVFTFSFVNRMPKAKNEAIHLIGFSSIAHHTALYYNTSHRTAPHHITPKLGGAQRISHTKWLLSTFTLIEFFTSNTTAAHRLSTTANINKNGAKNLAQCKSFVYGWFVSAILIKN